MQSFLLLSGIFFAFISSLFAEEPGPNMPSIQEKPIFRPKEIVEAQKEISRRLILEELKFETIRNSGEPLINKWQNFLGIILPIQMDVIKNYGFGSDQAALAHFNQQTIDQSVADPDLRELTEKKWQFLLEKAFGLKKTKKITLEQARNLIGDIASAMATETFLQEIDRAMLALPDRSSLLARRQQLLTVLFPLHMSVMGKHGFEGEQGYVQAQRALMDYYSDPFIMEQSQQAQITVFQRAKLIR